MNAKFTAVDCPVYEETFPVEDRCSLKKCSHYGIRGSVFGGNVQAEHPIDTAAETNTPPGEGRYNSYDLLRIFSAISVIIIHVNAHFFGSRAGAPSSSLYYVAESLLNIVTRFSVPAFIMISGAFILGNPANRDYIYFYKKSSYKIFLPTFAVIIIFFILSEMKWIITYHNPLPPLYALLIGGQYNLWFMYLLFGLYALVPFIIRLKEVTEKRVYKIVAYFMLFWSVVSQMTSTYALPYSIGVVFAFLSYFIIGNVLYEESNTQNKSSRAAMWFCAAIACFLITFFSRYARLTNDLFDPYTSFFSPTITLASICIFIGFGKLKINWHCEKLSSLTFFMYLFHTPIYGVQFRFRKLLPSNELLAIAAVVILTVLMSLGAAILFTKLWYYCESRWNWKKHWYHWRIWQKQLDNSTLKDT